MWSILTEYMKHGDFYIFNAHNLAGWKKYQGRNSKQQQQNPPDVTCMQLQYRTHGMLIWSRHLCIYKIFSLLSYIYCIIVQSESHSCDLNLFGHKGFTQHPCKTWYNIVLKCIFQKTSLLQNLQSRRPCKINIF